MRLFSITNGYLFGSIDMRRPIIACLNPGVIVSTLLWLQELASLIRSLGSPASWRRSTTLKESQGNYCQENQCGKARTDDYCFG
jgi:hypothetical protein